MTDHKTLAAALAAFQQDVPHVKKDRTARVQSDKGNYSYTYADLADVTAAALPALAKHGLSFSCKPTLDDAGNFVLAYTLRHAGSDESDSGTYPLPKTGTPQQVGSAISYGRRYVLSAVTGIVADEDDDGRAGGEASTAKAQRRAQQKPQQPAEDTVQAARAVLGNRAKALGVGIDVVDAEYQKRAGRSVRDETDPKAIRAFITGLDDGTVTITEPAGAA